MNGLAEIQELLKIDEEKLAQILGTTKAAISGWQTGKVEPDPNTRKMLRNMLHVVTEAQQFATPDAIVRWLVTPDPDFHDQPPIDLLASGFGTRLLEGVLTQTARGG